MSLHLRKHWYLTTASCVLEATVWKTAGIISDSSTFISMSFSVEKVVLGIAGGSSHKIISLLKRNIGFVSYESKNAKKNSEVKCYKYWPCTLPSTRRQIHLTPEGWAQPRLPRSWARWAPGQDTYRPRAVGAHSSVRSHALAAVDYQHLVLHSDLVLAVDGMLKVCNTAAREGTRYFDKHFYYQGSTTYKYLTD